jgi:putative hydrolase of HD superfamily
MFKDDGDDKLNVAKKERGIRPIDGKRFKSQIEFILEVDKLKKIMRRTMLMDRSRQENSAEHSWHIALIVLVLSEYVEADNLNLLRVIKLLLTHDLVEIDAGDTYCYDETGIQDQKERETRAADRLFNILPEDQAKSFRGLWDEYEDRKTPESKFANALDRFQPLLHNYFTHGQSWRQHGIQKKQVLSRMQPVDEGSSFLWDYVAGLIDDAVEKGFLAK